MEKINEQEGYIAEATQMVATARPCPVTIVDQMPNTMIPQWHRGSDWAVAMHAASAMKCPPACARAWALPLTSDCD